MILMRTGGAQLIVPGVSVQQAGGGEELTFLLRDDFTTPQAAPLTSPRTCEPGPGTLTITDTNSKLSIAGGKLTFATAGFGAGNPGVWGAQFARVVGRALVATRSASTNGLEIGWDSSQSGTILDCLRITGSASTIRAIGTVINADTLNLNVDYSLAMVQCSSGYLGFIKGGAFTSWTLAWVFVLPTSDAYPAISAITNSTIGTIEFIGVLDLPAPFDTDYGIATQRLAGAQSAGQTFTHEANCHIEWIQTTLPSASVTKLYFRMQDASNYWRVQVSVTGAITLYEVIADVSTSRGIVAGVLVNGHRVVVVADGNTIRVYSNNVLRLTYSSASNFATATVGELNALGTGGAVSEIISWLRTLTGAAAALLDAAIA